MSEHSEPSVHVVQVEVYASNVSYNKASAGGGAMFVTDSSVVQVLGSHLEGNTAPSGGAVQASGSAQVW